MRFWHMMFVRAGEKWSLPETVFEKLEGGWHAAAKRYRAWYDAARAYRRGRRYLRTHSIGEMTVADVARDAREATARLSEADAGLACSVTLAARL